MLVNYTLPLCALSNTAGLCTTLGVHLLELVK